jgi:serralysin
LAEGDDTFVFSTPLRKAEVERIAEFDSGEDVMVLDSAVFRRLDVGELDRDAFFHGRHAKDAEDRIGFDAKRDALVFDADGAGGKKAVVIAIIEEGRPDAHDFWIV